VKIVLAGETNVGKTCVAHRYVEDVFSADRHITVGASFLAKRIEKDGNMYKLHIWDTAGEAKFHSITPLYYRNADICLLVYSVIDKDSITRLPRWLKDIHDNAPEGVVIVLIGNKSDLAEEHREVKYEEGKKIADENKILFAETSAFSASGIAEAFDEALSRLPPPRVDPTDPVQGPQMRDIIGGGGGKKMNCCK